MSIRNQPTKEVDQKTCYATMSRMLNLRDVLELIDHTFHNGSLSEQDAIHEGHGQAVLGIGSELGDQLDTESLTE